MTEKLLKEIFHILNRLGKWVFAMVSILVLLLFNILSIFLKGKLLFLYFGSNVMNCNIPLRSDCRIPQLASHVSFLAASLHYSTIRIITSENDRKPKFDTRSTMKNWTSYVPNTHGPRWQVFGKLQRSRQTRVITTEHSVRYVENESNSSSLSEYHN